MYIIKKLLITLCIVFISISTFADIEPIFSISDVEILEAQKNETLVVFDIDDTLTILSEPAFQRPNFKSHHSELFAQIMDPLSLKEKVVAFTLPLLTTSGELIESVSPLSMQKLHTEGVKTIGLTAAMGGEIGQASLEERRIKELKRVGIDFSHSFLDLPEVVFPNFEKPIYGKLPVFKNGILFTNENNKGQVLVEFLKILDWKPKQIIFVDDRLDHLKAVENALLQYEPAIEYIGLHFQTDPQSYQTIDADRFKEQWTEIAEQAKEILSNKNRFYSGNILQ